MSKNKDIVSVKKSIRAILLSAKNGLTVDELRKDYKDMIGESIPLRELDCNSVMELVQKMPDVVSVHKSAQGVNILRGIADSRSVHVARMVSRQKSSKPYSAMKSGITKKLITPSKCISHTIPEVPINVRLKIQQLMISYPNGLPLNKFHEAFNKRFGYYLHVSSWRFANLRETLNSLDVVEVISSAKYGGEIMVYSSSRPKGMIEESLNSLETNQQKIPETVQVSNKPHPVPVEVTQQLCELLEASPTGIWASEILTDYKNYFHEDLPVSSLGYSSVIDMLMTLSVVIDLERPVESGDWLVFAKGKRTTALATCALSLPKGLVRIIHKILESVTSPITVSGFPELFKNTTNRELPVEEYGFSSTVEFLRKVPDVNIFPSDDNTEQLVAVCKIEPNEDKENTSKAKFSTYSHQPIPRGSKAFGVYVTYVKSPSYLCVQIIGDDTTQALDSLHEDMAEFYNSASGDKAIIERPAIGQPCCSRFNNDGYWYRTNVTSKPQPDIVEVRYVDYGNTGLVPIRSLRQPKPHYLALPAQAVECRLANIMPVGSSWSKKACELLFAMTKEKPIAAIVTSENVISVCLCDTTTDRDLHINDCLVNQGLALFSADSNKETVSINEYEMESLQSESSAKQVNVRLPNTTSSTESLHHQAPKLYESAQLSQQQMMLQLLTLMQQNSLLLQQPRYSDLHKQPCLPRTTDTSSIPIPPGFEKISTKTSSTPMLSPIELSPISNKEYIPIINSDSVTEDKFSSKHTVGTATDLTDIIIKKISLDATHSLHLIRYNDNVYTFSNEISSWFWECDLLQYKLHKIPHSPCGVLLYRQKVPSIFEQLKKLNNPLFAEALEIGQILLYSLEDFAVIVEKLECPQSLYLAIMKVIQNWKEMGADFWSSKEAISESYDKDKSLSTVITMKRKLKELQEKRTSLLMVLMKTSSLQDNPISNDHTFDEFVSIDKDIKNIKQKLAELEQDDLQSDMECTVDSLAFSVSDQLDNSFGDRLSLNSSITDKSDLGIDDATLNKPPSADDCTLFNDDTLVLVNERANKPLATAVVPTKDTPQLSHNDILPVAESVQSSLKSDYNTSKSNDDQRPIPIVKPVQSDTTHSSRRHTLSVNAQPFLPQLKSPSNASYGPILLSPGQPPCNMYRPTNPPHYSYPYNSNTFINVQHPHLLPHPHMYKHEYNPIPVGIGRGSKKQKPLLPPPPPPQVGIGRGEMYPNYVMNFRPIGSGVGIDII